MPDALFADPRLAVLYDALDGDRSDLDAYLQLLEEMSARSVVDIGCGTGTFACLLAARGFDVIGVDPAAASLRVAQIKESAELVRWVHGDATALEPGEADAATMTGNVAQVFVDDDDWFSTLAAVKRALRPGGHLVFEVRDPAKRAWESWTPERTRRRLDVPGVGPIETWTDVTSVALPLVSFRHYFVFPDSARVVSDSTLRFRSAEELAASLGAAGFITTEVRDAPDRPGLEWVFVARSQSASAGSRS